MPLLADTPKVVSLTDCATLHALPTCTSPAYACLPSNLVASSCRQGQCYGRPAPTASGRLSCSRPRVNVCHVTCPANLHPPACRRQPNCHLASCTRPPYSPPAALLPAPWGGSVGWVEQADASDVAVWRVVPLLFAGKAKRCRLQTQGRLWRRPPSRPGKLATRGLLQALAPPLPSVPAENGTPGSGTLPLGAISPGGTFWPFLGRGAQSFGDIRERCT